MPRRLTPNHTDSVSAAFDSDTPETSTMYSARKLENVASIRSDACSSANHLITLNRLSAFIAVRIPSAKDGAFRSGSFLFGPIGIRDTAIMAGNVMAAIVRNATRHPRPTAMAPASVSGPSAKPTQPANSQRTMFCSRRDGS